MQQTPQAPEKRVALAGNPNVGKSTVFNALTGMRQHTGNWPGKTVSGAQGSFSTAHHQIQLYDLPGTYSLLAHSAEEECARDEICFGKPDAVIVVCDATCLERNLILALQCMELAPRVLLCVNLLDEAERKGISVDLAALQTELGIPVVGIVAHKRATLRALTQALDALLCAPQGQPILPPYPAALTAAADALYPKLRPVCAEESVARWLSYHLLLPDNSLRASVRYAYGNIAPDESQLSVPARSPSEIQDLLTARTVESAHKIAEAVVHTTRGKPWERDRRLDRIFTGRILAFPVMLLLLGAILWLTIVGANVPSEWLSRALFALEGVLCRAFTALHAPAWLTGIVVFGAYRVLAWVVSVMLPPMAIFFPLFTLLEDAGYLPRVAYNLDRPLCKCHACGKQSLTMCMGFGCNAAAVVGCRIIDSPRERKLAMLTNAFIPCNGRFPLLITLISLFCVGAGGSVGDSLFAAGILLAFLVLAIFGSLAATALLSRTLYRGMPSAFALELPPYRRPRFLQVLVRSVCDRTLHVLGRAAVIAAPAGAILWLLANVRIGGAPILSYLATAFQPLGAILGMDGAILLAFLLALPANEIVLPIILMIYTAQGILPELGSTAEIGAALCTYGWTRTTAFCVMLFCIFHFPCATTLATIRKESGSWKDTALAAALPTACGMLLCFFVHLFA